MWSSVTKESRFVHLECNETLFQDTYKRNNKSSGSKHLRCFPHCCKSHNATGYCGSTLHIVTTAQHSDLIVFAKFDLETESSMHVGKIVKLNSFDEAHYIRGCRIEKIVALDSSPGQIFEINSKRNSWHYGWVSSRFVKSTVLHQMKVYILMPVDNMGNVYCVDILTSRSFKIESTRTGTKLMAKLNQSKSTSPKASLQEPQSLSKKRPHLVLQDTEEPKKSRPAPRLQPQMSPYSNRAITSSNVPHSSSSVPLVQPYPPVPKQPFYVPFHPQYQQPPLYEPPRLHKPPASFLYPAVNNFVNEVVLGNGDFLDSLITAMEDEDDATPRP